MNYYMNKKYIIELIVINQLTGFFIFLLQWSRVVGFYFTFNSQYTKIIRN